MKYMNATVLALGISAMLCCFSTFINAKQLTVSEKEQFANISDSTVKREVASFSIAGHSKYSDSKAVGLKEIRLWKYTDSSVLFDNAGILSADIMVKIEATRTNQRTVIKEVKLTRDTKRIYILPEKAVVGLNDPNFCYMEGKKWVSNCKVFRSRDKKRFYIYMLNGNEGDRYEVTWIIQQGRYLARVIDRVRD